MKVGMYSVKNCTTHVHGQPFLATTDEEAKSMFDKAFEESKEKTDEKFELIKLGYFDIVSGELDIPKKEQ